MKKNHIFILILGAVLCAALISCQSTGKKPKPEKFTVDLDSPQTQIGEIEVQLEALLGIGKIKKYTVPVFYFPHEDAVVLRYRVEFTTFNQCWNADGRQLFIEALQKYNEDYDARNLDIKGGKNSLRKYGKVKEGYLIWQQFQYTTRARANMELELGYTFKDRAPYFVVNQLKAEYIDSMSRDSNRTSLITPHYFTRTQAAELAALFDPEFVSGLKTGAIRSNINKESDRDEY